MVLALPEDMLRDEVEALDRPKIAPIAQPPCAGAMEAMFGLLKDATNPVAIIGGAGWDRARRIISQPSPSATAFPTAAAFRRQDAIGNDCGVYAGQLGYGPNPKLQQRIREADLLLVVGARLGEATTDGYKLVTPDHPDQLLVHVHPDPNELGRVFKADLPICADMGEFAEMAADWHDPDLVRFHAGEEAHREWLEWSRAGAARRRQARPRPVRQGDARRAAGQHHHLQRRRQFLRLVAPLLALWRRCRPSLRRPAARWATACPPRSPPRCASRTGRWSASPATAIS